MPTLSLRAVILGLLLGLAISASTYFNDHVIRQTMLIGNLFPVGIFGVIVFVLVVVNPLLKSVALRNPEIALITAIGLAACGWPGSNFFRSFTGTLARPAALIKDQPAWQAARVMSYIPGGSAQIGAAHISNWDGLVRALRQGARPDAPAPVACIWSHLPADVQSILDAAGQRSRVSPLERVRIIAVLNSFIDDEGFYRQAAFAAVTLPEPAERLRQQRRACEAAADRCTQEIELLKRQRDGPADRLEHQIRLLQLTVEHLRGQVAQVDQHLHRLLLVACFPDMLAPPPAGDGWLVNGGRSDLFATAALIKGWSGQRSLRITELPWDTWAPTLKLWVTVALLFGLAALFQALIVHPQWSGHEQLAYPIARFVAEIGQREPGRRLPSIAQSNLFWLAMGIVLVIHIINGLKAWFPQFIEIPLRYNFYPLRGLFENASLAPHTWALYLPHLYFCVVGFAYFLRTEVSLSLGLVGVACMILSQICHTYSTPLSDDFFLPGNFSLLLFGAWLGGAIMVLYIGRRYYLNVLGAAVGLRRQIDTPPYAIWATRGLAACVFGAAWALTHAGLDWVLSLLFVGLVLLMFFMLARICAETGFFFILPGWLPVGVLLALFGHQALGPAAYLLLAIASIIVVGDPREALIPYLVNGLQMTDRAQTAPRRSAPWLGVMIVSGFFVALGVTLTLQYNLGLDLTDARSAVWYTSAPYNNATRMIGELSATEQIAQAHGPAGLGRLTQVRPKAADVGWMGLGAVLVITCALARLRLAWWPIHPVIFMVFGSYSAMCFAWAFLIGWAIKAAVVRLGGTRSYHALRPLMVGMICGEIFAALIWTVVGAIYYWATDGGIPKAYLIFPA